MTAQGPDELQVLSRIQCVMSLSTITVVGAIKIYSCYLHLTLLNNMNEYYKVALFVLQKSVPSFGNILSDNYVASNLIFIQQIQTTAATYPWPFYKRCCCS